jgi:hypothetical protein
VKDLPAALEPRVDSSLRVTQLRMTVSPEQMSGYAKSVTVALRSTHSVRNLCTVVCEYVSPGFRIVVGKSG